MHKLRHTPGDPEEGLRAALESVAGPGPVYVLGLGYVDKADDGAGVLVAENLKKHFPEFSFSEHDGVEGTVLDISERPGPATVFFVDAADLGAVPGTVYIVERADIKDTEISTHRVPVALMAAILERTGKRT
jgi:hydrogenase maturation protease